MNSDDRAVADSLDFLLVGAYQALELTIRFPGLDIEKLNLASAAVDQAIELLKLSRAEWLTFLLTTLVDQLVAFYLNYGYELPPELPEGVRRAIQRGRP